MLLNGVPRVTEKSKKLKKKEEQQKVIASTYHIKQNIKYLHKKLINKNNIIQKQEDEIIREKKMPKKKNDVKLCSKKTACHLTAF